MIFAATSAMMHQTKTRNGISSMTMVRAVTIPSHGKVAFKPGGLHVMLAGLKAPLEAGGTQTMSLRFRKAGTVKAPFRVVDMIK